jgi:DNA-binding CsgD family transcriptional regulator
MPPPAADEHLRRGRRAIAAGRWDEARAHFAAAGALGARAAMLEGLGRADHFEGRHADAVRHNEEAFEAYRAEDDPAGAAEVARWLAFLNGLWAGDLAVAAGWMARAARLLDGVDERPVHGWVRLDHAVFTTDPGGRARIAEDVLEIARRQGDADLEWAARALLGNAAVARGDVARGMRLLDEAMAAIAGGEVTDPGAVADIFCRLLSACEAATDVRRAEEWMAAAQRLAPAGLRETFVAPTCRCHLGGVLVAGGRWDEAERHLTAALEAFEAGLRAERAAPLLRLATLRALQGRFEEAERLLEGIEWQPAARACLSTVALARGEHDLAEDLARRCLDGRDPSDPACGPMLEVLVTARLGRGDRAGAREALGRLRALAAARGDDRAVAMAHLAEGRVRAAEGDERAAVALTAALERFASLDLPLEAGRARLALAASLGPVSPSAAAAEARLALTAFERLGAARDADAAAALLRGLGAPGRAGRRLPGPLTRREEEVLELLAAGLSNRQIAERLVISPRTAEHHVARVLGKLALRSRAEAAAYALRTRGRDG